MDLPELHHRVKALAKYEHKQYPIFCPHRALKQTTPIAYYQQRFLKVA